jgi:hypothetical protein
MIPQIEPLVKRRIFASEEEAIQSLVRDYILRQVTALQQEIGRLEEEYGMNFQQFGKYVHERSILLEQGGLSDEQRIALNRRVMQEEDDWLDWKAAQEMLENWLGLSPEAVS